MQKIIDIRFRPPIGTFLQMAMFKNTERTASMARAAGIKLAPSVEKRSLDLLIQEMDSLGKYIGFVEGLKRGDRAWGWIENDEIDEIVKKYPERFIGIGGIDGGDRGKALEDIDRCIQEFGFKGIAMEPTNHKEPMRADDRRLYPLYSKCADLGIPVFLLLGGNIGRDVSDTDPAHVDRVAADMPELKIVVHHGAWPWVSQVLQVCYRRPNVYLSADMYLFFPGGDQYVRAINTFLGERFLYATAYPFGGDTVVYYREFLKLGIKEEVRDNVLYKNAENLLKLK